MAQLEPEDFDMFECEDQAIDPGLRGLMTSADVPDASTGIDNNIELLEEGPLRGDLEAEPTAQADNTKEGEGPGEPSGTISLTEYGAAEASNDGDVPFQNVNIATMNAAAADDLVLHDEDRDIPIPRGSQRHEELPANTSAQAMGSASGRQSRMSIVDLGSDDDFMRSFGGLDSDNFSDVVGPVSGRQSRMSGIIETSDPTPAKDAAADSKVYDIVNRVNGMYRLLDLVAEEGSTGLVEKVIIDSDGMRRFMDAVSAGAYTSMTRVNFRALDTTVLHPVGVYGSKEALIQFLRTGNKIDEETAELLQQERSTEAVDRPALRSGLYVVHANSDSPDSHLIYVVYWPEDTTWNDDAGSGVKRNRVTFMRYLTKLCDQTICLISPDHCDKLVWGETSDAEDDEEMEDVQENDRLFSFQVKKTTEQEDNVEVLPGFKLYDRMLQPDTTPSGVPGDCDARLPRLVAGETSQAVMTMAFVPGRIDKVDMPKQCTPVHLASLLRDAKSIKLGRDISNEGIAVLVNLGLKALPADVCNRWHQRMRQISTMDKTGKEERFEVADTEIRRAREQILATLKLATLQSICELYGNDVFSGLLAQELLPERPATKSTPLPSDRPREDPSSDGDSSRDGGDSDEEVDLDDEPHRRVDASRARGSNKTPQDEYDFRVTADWAELVDRYPDIEEALTTVRDTRWNEVLLKQAEYLNLKTRFIAALQFAAAKDEVDEEEKTQLASRIVSNKGPKLDQPFEISSGPIRKLKNFFKGFVGSSSELTIDPKSTPNHEFIAFALRSAEEESWLAPVVDHIVLKCVETTTKVARELCGTQSHLAASKIERARKAAIKEETEKIAATLGNDARLEFLDAVRPRLPSDPGKSIFLSSVAPCSERGRNFNMVKLNGRTETPQQPKVAYTLTFLSLSPTDQAAIRRDSTFVPSPRLTSSGSITFMLPSTTSVKHIQVIDMDRVLLVTEDAGGLEIFVEKRGGLQTATLRHTPKRSFRREKLGHDVLVAYDESAHLLVILSTELDRCTLHVFAVDDRDSVVRPRGSPVDIFRWFETAPLITNLCFVSGSSQEEICLVEASGRVRIFSLVTEQCRPASLQLGRVPSQIFSSPDGSCLFIVSNDGVVIAYHWDGFGSSHGITLTLPIAPDAKSAVLTSLASRSSVHLLTINVEQRVLVSSLLKIQKKSSEFRLREDAQARTAQARVLTAHNCLIECLSDVWTRFPVVPAIGQDVFSVGHAQKRITYLCNAHQDQFQSHFNSMVRQFERVTRKPTQRLLDKIMVDAMTFDAFLTTGITWPLTSVRAGDWLIQCICLLPLQIAVARDNRFLPLKDGVWSSTFEQQMLGSSVNQVADSITFGWYESIFTHYDKPVKVVSSMGEQSTGKSYMLAHLVDTSFAGSAMRCTEGVWMCVTPTAETLYVALDFEGVHSLERSVQEDALLVLFNAAISNMILFRNNFALSRNIAGMFTSFQSSSSLFDPEANPTLFQSCLVIIIKDVVDADTAGIVQEFRDKFQRIVADEQEANFLTKLHRGQLKINPWPVIESRKYYTAYNQIKTQLQSQPISHPRAGVFLHTMKTLMAKIKACDWGALDQNLASHRAEQMRSSLLSALLNGLDEDGEPLKDIDTNTFIPHSDTMTEFRLEGPTFNVPDDPMAREATLTRLRASVDSQALRQGLPDDEWMAELCLRLDNLLQARIAHVKDWFTINSARFDGHADIQQLARTMDAGIIELRDSVLICKSKCYDCNLLCTASKRHSGPHDCQSGHACRHGCSFVDEHDGEVPHCGLPAGHAGKHMCEVGAHLCGQPCALDGKPGCIGGCMKLADHVDVGHLCSAQSHGCGQPCALEAIGLCVEPCNIPHDRAHERHDCKTKGCPHSCTLCKRLCSDPDHFHGLRDDAVHLCGQEHACDKFCSSDGFCEVSTDPIAVESTFTGRHDTFQFTKYTQNARKLVCAVIIPPGEITHEGSHVHDAQSAKPFHYCKTRCPSCSYVCHLPYGHTQREHETAHGSMSNTEWAVEGGADVSFELEGHRFGAGDIGAPMLCSVYCSALGRHAHIDLCKASGGAPCGGREHDHISARLNPDPAKAKDYITHALFWRRSGFKDPYSREEQAGFALCDAMCAAPEHQATETTAAQPSLCTLPLFHAPRALTPAPATGYVSNDGHVFPCANPAVTNQTYHIVFVIDRSSSMGYTDIVPLAGTPVTDLIARHAYNRLGAVYSAVYTMWGARHGAGAALRRDAYSVILFGNTATTIVENDLASNPGTLLGRLLGHTPAFGTHFDNALRETQRVMEAQWNNDRAPVVIFLSDGECGLTDALVTDMCRRAVVLGKPLAFHAVSFGSAERSGTLDLMAHRAREVYRTAPGGGANADTQCTSTRALDTVRLAETFIGIADSLKKPRAALVRYGR